LGFSGLTLSSGLRITVAFLGGADELCLLDERMLLDVCAENLESLFGVKLSAVNPCSTCSESLLLNSSLIQPRKID
jgi:hypothetical protein